MIDPISTAASILAFIDAIAKVKGAIDKVGHTNGRFTQVKKDVILGLKDIEIFCRNRHTSLNEADTKELKQGVDDLRKDLLHVCAGIQKHNSRKEPKNVLSSAKSNTQAWFRRRNLEHEITRLEKHIQDCQIRFLSFNSARTEHRTIIHHRENTRRMNHIDDMLSDILVPQQLSQNSKSPFGPLNFFDLLGGQLESSNNRPRVPKQRPQGPASPFDFGFPFGFPMLPGNIANQSGFGGDAQIDLERPIARSTKQALSGFTVAILNVVCYLITLLWCTDLRSAFAWLINMSAKVYEACKPGTTPHIQAGTPSQYAALGLFPFSPVSSTSESAISPLSPFAGMFGSRSTARPDSRPPMMPQLMPSLDEILFGMPSYLPFPFGRKPMSSKMMGFPPGLSPLAGIRSLPGSSLFGAGTDGLSGLDSVFSGHSVRRDKEKNEMWRGGASAAQARVGIAVSPFGML